MLVRSKFILSLDGGGIRGIVPTLVLQELQRALADHGWFEPLHKTFDMIAGTSTGGIIAAGLSASHKFGGRDDAVATPADLTQFYEEDGPSLFSRSWWTRIKTGNGLLGPRYSSDNLVALLKHRFGETTKISEALTCLVLTAYDLEGRAGKFLTNGPDRTGKPSDDYWLWEAVQAGAAAPTFFPPAYVHNLTKQTQEALIDGGVFANDPVLAAVVEGRKMGWRLEDMVVLSLGTGLSNRRITHKRAHSWGPLSWINPANGSPIISIFMQGQASTAAYQAHHLLSGAAANGKISEHQYLRVDAALDGPSDDLDDVSASNITKLKAFAAALIENFSGQIEGFAKKCAEGHLSSRLE